MDVPDFPLSGWLKDKLPDWEIQHVNELGFQGKPDEFLNP
jgi:hypothetical protein